MLAYGYDRRTGEYTGPVNAWEDQLTPGEYLLPANSTLIVPPEHVAGKHPMFNGTEWVQVDIPVIQPEVIPTPTTQELAAKNRKLRNDLLSSCDWTQLPDLPSGRLANAATWATYRQALRNVPQQPGFPNTINWPTAPES